MLDKVDREEGLGLIRPQLDQAKGVVLILGDSAMPAAVIASSLDVDRVLVATTNEHFKATVKDLPFTKATLEKIEHVNRNPFRLQRRNLDHAIIDYLFADLWPDAWNLARIEELRTIAREFRPRRMGYRWQELDVAANWVAKGYDLDAMDASAIDIYRIETGLMIEDRTNDYATRCAAVARQHMGRR